MKNKLKRARNEHNLIGLLTSGLGQLLLILGVIIGILVITQGDEESMVIGIIILISSITLGLLLLGLGEVIRLLQLIVYKERYDLED